VIHNDYASLSPSRRKGLPEGHAPIVRELVVPILRNDLVVMIMGVGNKPYEYDDNDVEALSQLAGSVWDIVQRKQAEEALKTSERKHRLLHESMIDGFVSADMEGNFLDCNEIYRNMLGYSVADLAQLTYKDITPEKWRAIEAGIVENQIIKRGYSDIYEKEYIRKDGTTFPVELHTVLLRDVDGKPAGMWAIVRDVTERKQAEEALRESELFIKNVLNSITAHIAVLDGQGKIVTVNEAWKQFARENGNTDPESYIGTNYFMACEAAIQLGDGIALQVDHAIHAVMNGLQDEFSIEYPCHSPTRQRWFILTVVPQQKSRQGVIVIHQDITERKQAEQMLKEINLVLQTTLEREKELARTDPLTGINNRRRLFEMAEHEFEVAERYQQPLAVMMYDLDHFKKVNDTFDHSVGDLILQRVTQIVRDELRSADVIGRYGGEEFIVLLPMTNAQQAFQLAERIRINVEALGIETAKGVASVTLSIGIVELHTAASSETVEDVFRLADEAMYAAKQAGRNRTEIR
jgi:diguanylate cyclase (GGDEF)-like protein/PAS domain S-box-containing protein